MIRNRDHVLKFGKYKGKTLGEVVEIELDWIRWAVREIKDFIVDDDIAESLRTIPEKPKPRKRRGMFAALEDVDDDYWDDNNPYDDYDWDSWDAWG